MCNIVILLKNKKITINDTFNNKFIDRIIYSYHPFPILERYCPINDIQYFIPLDTLCNFDNFNNNTKSLVFGYGIRRCAGTYYAYQILESFIKKYFSNNNLFNPSKNHLYSGRINDKFVLTEIIYMFYKISKILFTVLKNYIFGE